MSASDGSKKYEYGANIQYNRENKGSVGLTEKLLSRAKSSNEMLENSSVIFRYVRKSDENNQSILSNKPMPEKKENNIKK